MRDAVDRDLAPRIGADPQRRRADCRIGHHRRGGRIDVRQRDRGVRARVLLAGDGELRRRLDARIARERLGEVVKLLGAQPHEAIPELLAGATAMVLPSIRARDGQMEGIPVALMEAMAAGVPVVATRLSGIPELVVDGESGLLVPERDPAALADAMARLAGDAALGARLAYGGRIAVQERFDRARNVEALEALLVGGPGRVGRPAAAPGPERVLAPG